MPARHFLRQHWPTVTIAVTAAAIGCAAIVMFSNMPPHAIAMATGSEGDTYYDIGQRYRTVLARANVEVQLVPTAGSVENLASLLNANLRERGSNRRRYLRCKKYIRRRVAWNDLL